MHGLIVDWLKQAVGTDSQKIIEINKITILAQCFNALILMRRGRTAELV